MKKQESMQLAGTALDVEQLLGTHDRPCVSILANLSMQASMLKQNALGLKQSFAQALGSIGILPAVSADRDALQSNLQSALDSFRNEGTAKAVGIYATPKNWKLIEFPFLVNEGVVIGDTLQVRDLLYWQQYHEGYYAVNIHKDAIRLYHGAGQSLREVVNEIFPATFKDDYEYEHASIGSSYGYALKGFEKDKKNIANLREATFVKSICNVLPSFINDFNAQVVVAGPARMTSEMAEGYPYPGNVHRINSTFKSNNIGEFRTAVWDTIVEARKRIISDAIHRIDELPLSNRAKGLRKVWEAAQEGRGMVLLVERDFQRVGYAVNEGNAIRLHSPEVQYKRVTDAVDDAMEAVRNKHGKVIFTEPGALHKYEGIVLTLRY